MILHSKMGLLTLLKANILWLLQRSLHSNMGLLKRRSRISLLYYPNFYIPNMFLLKLFPRQQKRRLSSSFTFHNVSIKTQGSSENLSSDPHLHSTMFLLKLKAALKICLQILIYIPQCFYQNYNESGTFCIMHTFTFHNVSIKTCAPQPSVSRSGPIYIPQCFY